MSFTQIVSFIDSLDLFTGGWFGRKRDARLSNKHVLVKHFARRFKLYDYYLLTQPPELICYSHIIWGLAQIKDSHQTHVALCVSCESISLTYPFGGVRAVDTRAHTHTHSHTHYYVIVYIICLQAKQLHRNRFHSTYFARVMRWVQIPLSSLPDHFISGHP